MHIILKHRKKEVSEKLTLLKLCDKEAITRNYDAYEPRLWRLKGEHWRLWRGNYAWEKSVRLSFLSSPFAGVIVLSRNIRDTFIHTAVHTRLTRLDALQIVDSHIYILITRLFHFLAVRTCYACIGTQPLVFLLFFHLLLVIISAFWQSYIKHDIYDPEIITNTAIFYAVNINIIKRNDIVTYI